MITILLLSLVGVVISVVVGTLWYSSGTPMGRIHMTYLGFDKLSPEEQKTKIEEAKPKMPKIYGAQMFLSLFTSFFVVFVVSLSIRNGISAKGAILFPLFSWLCFVVPTVGSAILWGNVDRSIAWRKFFSDAGAQLATILLISLLTILFV